MISTSSSDILAARYNAVQCRIEDLLTMHVVDSLSRREGCHFSYAFEDGVSRAHRRQTRHWLGTSSSSLALVHQNQTRYFLGQRVLLDVPSDNLSSRFHASRVLLLFLKNWASSSSTLMMAGSKGNKDVVVLPGDEGGTADAGRGRGLGRGRGRVDIMVGN